MKDEEHKYLNKTIEEHKVKLDMNEDLIDVNTRKNEEHKCLNTKYRNTKSDMNGDLIDVNTRNDEEHARASRSPGQNTTKAEYHRLLVFLFHFPFN